MAISIDPLTFEIFVPKADTLFVEINAITGYEIRSFDEYVFMRELGDYLDSYQGMSLPVAFIHETETDLSGVTYSRKFKILSPYTLTLENGTYQVRLNGGTNNNLLDILNPNSVSIIPNNSAGKQTVSIGSGLDTGEKVQLRELHDRFALNAAKPITHSDNSISNGSDIDIQITDNGNGTFTEQRQ